MHGALLQKIQTRGCIRHSLEVIVIIPAIIPARSGSVGVKNKNMRELKGKPLLHWMVEAAVNAKRIDTVFVSSDSTAYIESAMALNEDKVRGLVRPPALAEDVPTEDVIIDALKEVEDLAYRVTDPVVTLQCTTSDDIDNAVEIYQNSRANSVISVTPSRDYPHWLFQIDEEKELIPFMDIQKLNGLLGVRQNLPIFYRPNGAIYITSAKELKKQKTLFARPIRPYIMPLSRSWEVDEEDDLKILEVFAA